MKISISYPPLPDAKGVPLLSQNRQFQWFSSPTYIYPVVPAYAATMLSNEGFEVTWNDGIAEGLSYSEWLDEIRAGKPDIIVLETKTPVVKKHWRIIDDIQGSARVGWRPVTILVGDHVTAYPKESMERSQVDYVLTGGDYDFLLVNLTRELVGETDRGRPSRKCVARLEPGIWYRRHGRIRSTGGHRLTHELSDLPMIDRNLTRWWLYAHKNGNFKYTPGAYAMAGRDCWWGKCTFCSWTTLYPGGSYRTMTVRQLLDEVGNLIDQHKVKEVFDDSGCFPKGPWLEKFCNGMIERGYHKRVTLGCNTRVNAQTKKQFRLMKRANFRFILIGLESVNQHTLNRLRKGVRVADIAETCRLAKEVGLEPHLTIMVGYPWETRKDADQTITFARSMFRKGYIDSLQATVVVPYPGTPLFEEAKRSGWLISEDWDRYDMKHEVWNSPIAVSEMMGLSRQLYRTALSPQFILRKLSRIRSADDIRFYWMAGRKLLSHLSDFAA